MIHLAGQEKPQKPAMCGADDYGTYLVARATCAECIRRAHETMPPHLDYDWRPEDDRAVTDIHASDEDYTRVVEDAKRAVGEGVELRRERDEARAEIKRLTIAADGDGERISDLTIRAERERDAERERFENVLVNIHSIARDAPCEPGVSIGMATAAVAELRRQRDELLKEVATLDEQCDRYCRERDEARQEAEHWLNERNEKHAQLIECIGDRRRIAELEATLRRLSSGSWCPQVAEAVRMNEEAEQAEEAAVGVASEMVQIARTALSAPAQPATSEAQVNPTENHLYVRCVGCEHYRGEHSASGECVRLVVSLGEEYVCRCKAFVATPTDTTTNEPK